MQENERKRLYAAARIEVYIGSLKALLINLGRDGRSLSADNVARWNTIREDVTALAADHHDQLARHLLESADTGPKGNGQPTRPTKARRPSVTLQNEMINLVNQAVQGLVSPVEAIDRLKSLIDQPEPTIRTQ